MKSYLKSRRLAALAVLVALSGCGGTRPAPDPGIASSQPLQPGPGETSGPDRPLENIGAGDMEALAPYVQMHFSEALDDRLAMASFPSPATLRVKAILAGTPPNARVEGTFLSIDLADGDGPLGKLDASKTGRDKAAEDLVAHLN